MRHAVLVILLFLLIGAVLNVAAAWACERFIQVRVIDTTLLASERRAEFARSENDPGNRQDRWVVDAFVSTGTQITRFSSSGALAEVRRVGWPCRSMGCTLEYRSAGNSNWTKHISGGLPIDGFNFLSRDVAGMGMATGMQAVERVLPLQPLWPGFAVNSLFWAIMAWLTWSTPGWIRSGVWILRRRCARCGYPIGVSPVCTECGRRVRRLKRQRAGGDDAKMSA